MYNNTAEIVKSFPSKAEAINFLGILKAERVLLVKTDADYKLVYTAERSVVDGEIDNSEKEPLIPTS